MTSGFQIHLSGLGWDQGERVRQQESVREGNIERDLNINVHLEIRHSEDHLKTVSEK